MSKLSRDLIDLLYKHYLFDHILLHIEAAHAEPFIFEFEKCSNWLIFQTHIILCLPMQIFICSYMHRVARFCK